MLLVLTWFMPCLGFIKFIQFPNRGTLHHISLSNQSLANNVNISVLFLEQ